MQIPRANSYTQLGQLSPHRFLRLTYPSWVTLAMGLAFSTVVFGTTFASPLTSVDNVVISNIFDPKSTPAWLIHDLSILVLLICAGIFVVVAGLMIYTIIRFRQRKDDDGREPPQVYGSNQMELAWTVIPILIVLILFLVSARTIYEVEARKPPANALHVTIVGHQWWWEIKYPGLGFVTANEIHVPVSDPADPRPTFFRLESADVIHSFWIPRLAGKVDVVPNRINRVWIEPLENGTYLGQCAEYCGTQHAHMLLRVIVHPKEEFDAWVKAQQQAPVADPTVEKGRSLFQSVACINCHTVGDTVADGTFGPDLSHLMSRETIAAGAAANDRASLHKWLRNPDLIKPGALMPDMKLSEPQVKSIVDYLVTLK
jgi:cytochrome c oxidase subunit 2